MINKVAMIFKMEKSTSKAVVTCLFDFSLYSALYAIRHLRKRKNHIPISQKHPLDLMRTHI